MMRATLAALCLAGPALADPALCIADRDAACIIAELPAATRAAVAAEPYAAESVLPETLVELRQWEHAIVVLDAFRGRTLVEGWPLIEAYGYGRDPQALESFALSVGQPEDVIYGISIMAVLAALDGDKDTAFELIQDRAAAHDDVLFLLVDHAAKTGDFAQAYDFASRTGAESHSASLQRIAWYAGMQGMDADKLRAANALLNIHETAPQRDRPTTLDHLRGIFFGDIDEQVANLELSGLPEISNDLDYRAIHSILAGLLLFQIGPQDATAQVLIDESLAALSSEMQTYGSEIDDVIVQLAAVAFDFGQVENANRIFAIRDDGGATFQNYLFHDLRDETAAHFIFVAIDQLRSMVEGHVSDARPIEYLEWKLSEGLYEDVATLCETLIRLEKDSEAAALYDWSVSITQPYVQPLPDGSEISDLLYFRCHRPETAQRDYFSAQRLAAPSFAKLYAAHDAGNFAALETLLLAVGANAGSDALLYLAQRDTDPALYAVVERFLTQLRTYEDEIRPDAAFDADSFAKRAMMLRLAYGFDGAEADFARIDNPVEKADALISALWALDPEPKYFAFLEGDATVWYFSKVAAIPGFYTH